MHGVREEAAMTQAYVEVVVLLYVAFAGAAYFLFRQSAKRFARLFAASWLIEALRAGISLGASGAPSGGADLWFALSDGLNFVANWWLLCGCAALADVRLPRWLGPAYFWSGVPVVMFNRFGLEPLVTWFGVEVGRLRFQAITFNLALMFVPVAVMRGAISFWFFRLWRRMKLPGALVAAVFCLPYAVMALAVPFQFSLSWSPDWLALLWCVRVLGFSIGLVVLMLNLQQRATEEGKARLAEAQAVAKIGSWEFDARAMTVVWSDELFRIFGRDPRLGVLDELGLMAALYPRDRAKFHDEREAAKRERRTAEHEFRILRPDGTIRWLQSRTTPCMDAAGNVVRLIGVAQDITERKRAEARGALQHAVTLALAEGQPQELTIQKILEIIALGLEAEVAAFWVVARGAQRLRCAQTWCPAEAEAHDLIEQSRTIEYPVGRGLPGRLLAERRPIFIGDPREADPTAYPRMEAAMRAKIRSGCGFPILTRTEVFGVVEVFFASALPSDPELVNLFQALGSQIGQFMDRLRLEEQYRQSQKMEAIGTLAGGIAHDFNNMLTAIGGYCELAQLEVPTNSAAATYLQAVRDGSRRATELVRQIMAFSRQQLPQRTPVDLAKVVEEAMRLLRATTPATVEIKTRYERELRPVLADPTAIHQIVVNLCTNACHSMKDRPGRLNVAVMPFVVDEDFARSHRGLLPGNYIELVVEDTGTGMDAATLDRIFEPFFTTKGPGEGTGLGLAVVHGIVQSHDGAIFVYSMPGEGTRFHLYFPTLPGEVMPECKGPEDIPVGRKEIVLYVEDEPQIAEMGRQMLRRLGYTPEVWERPLDALARLHVRATDVAVLITDLTMPGMTGIELARQAHQLRPGLPVVLMSGYASDMSSVQLAGTGVRAFVGKPHTLEQLAQALASVLPPTSRT